MPEIMAPQHVPRPNLLQNVAGCRTSITTPDLINLHGDSVPNASLDLKNIEAQLLLARVRDKMSCNAASLIQLNRMVSLLRCVLSVKMANSVRVGPIHLLNSP